MYNASMQIQPSRKPTFSYIFFPISFLFSLDSPFIIVLIDPQIICSKLAYPFYIFLFSALQIKSPNFIHNLLAVFRHVKKNFLVVFIHFLGP